MIKRGTKFLFISSYMYIQWPKFVRLFQRNEDKRLTGSPRVCPGSPIVDSHTLHLYKSQEPLNLCLYMDLLSTVLSNTTTSTCIKTSSALLSSNTMHGWIKLPKIIILPQQNFILCHKNPKLCVVLPQKAFKLGGVNLVFIIIFP